MPDKLPDKILQHPDIGNIFESARLALNQKILPYLTYGKNSAAELTADLRELVNTYAHSRLRYIFGQSEDYSSTAMLGTKLIRKAGKGSGRILVQEAKTSVDESIKEAFKKFGIVLPAASERTP